MSVFETSESSLPASPRRVTEVEFSQIKEALAGLQFGAVQIIVQDGVIVQIDRTEKRRLRRPDRKPKD